MQTIQTIFSSTTLRSGSTVAFADLSETCFYQKQTPSLYQNLIDAVSDLRTYFAERSLHVGLKAAKGGVGSLIDYLVHGGRLTTARDQDGLDAGYYIARLCVPYDFTALGMIERVGAMRHVVPLRYYNQHVDGRAAFIAALEAGLTFSNAADADGHTAGFFIARSGDEELIARFEQAGGTFRQRELEYLNRAKAMRSVA